MGLTPIQKMAGQLVVTGLFAYYLLKMHGHQPGGEDSLYAGERAGFGLAKYPPFIFYRHWNVNGANFTDGLDAWRRAR